VYKPPAGGFFIRVDGIHYVITHTTSASGTKRTFLFSQWSAMNEKNSKYGGSALYLVALVCLPLNEYKQENDTQEKNGDFKRQC
jgi:hypothetical protein